MFKLAHISDLHLAPLPQVNMRDLFSKRITGYANWQKNRKKHHHPDILPGLISHLNTLHPDHLAVTGDLVNLALPQELYNALRFLKNLGNSKDVTVVCGNHDAYVHGALEQAFELWQDYLVADNGERIVSDASFPTLRIRDNIAIIGCNSARATAPFKATGYFTDDQAARLTQILLEQKKADRCRVVLIHHPPFKNATASHKRLIGSTLFRSVIEECGAELVLHGHTHLDTIKWLEGADGKVPVVCVAAAGQAPGAKRPAAFYNLFEISGGQYHNWSINLKRFGYPHHPHSGAEGHAVRLLHETRLLPGS